MTVGAFMFFAEVTNHMNTDKGRKKISTAPSLKDNYCWHFGVYLGQKDAEECVRVGCADQPLSSLVRPWAGYLVSFSPISPSAKWKKETTMLKRLT